jgi:murein L,D-transpeptidase YafK
MLFQKPPLRRLCMVAFAAVVCGLAAQVGLRYAGRVNAQSPSGKRDEAAAARVLPDLKKALEAKGLRAGAPVFIRIFKEERQLELWVRKDDGAYALFRTYPVVAMSGELGPKLAEGDNQAPEGFYHVPSAAMKPDSTFHLAFNLGYPNAYDRAHGRTGSFLMVHGNEVSIGCYAMTNEKIEEIYTLCDLALKNGQPFFRVHAFPFRMTDKRMADAAGNKWEDFWKNLKEGYDFFERGKTPPEVTVSEGRYVFHAAR